MVVVLFGPPGCGKGTQSPRIARWLGVPAISTGELLRAEVAAGTPLGAVVGALLAQGQYASDEVATELLRCRLAQSDCAGGFLLDGYPRTVPQVSTLAGLIADKGLPEPVVLHLHAPETKLLDRLVARRQCGSCGRIYHLREQPPRQVGLCDDGCGPLARRDDDEAQIITQRLRTHERLTEPVVRLYRGTRYHAIDGDRSPDAVFHDIQIVLRTLFPAQTSVA